MKLKNYLNRIVILFLIVCLCSCSKNDIEVSTHKYIEPVNDKNFFSRLNEETKDILFNANTGNILNDGQLKLFNKELPNLVVKDIDGNDVDFNDYINSNIVLEVVSKNCTHCKEQIRENNSDIIENHNELTFIQYFVEGNREEILEVYRNENAPIEDSVIIIPECEDFLNYLLDVGVELTPALICYSKGKITWPQVGPTTLSMFNRFYDVAFSDVYNDVKFIDNDGNSIFDNNRSVDDVRNDLSEENIKLLEDLDEDGFTVSETLSIIGNTIDFSNCAVAMDNSVPVVDDFSIYNDKNVVLFYLYMSDFKNLDLDHINLLSRIVKENSDIEFITIVIDEDSSSTSYSVYKKYNKDIGGLVVSSKSNLPKDTSKIEVSNFPSAIFIEKGTFVGAFSGLSDIKGFNNAKKLFFGENSIAYLENN